MAKPIDLSPRLINEQTDAVLDTLSERRKSDRIMMARHLAAVVIECGAKATVAFCDYDPHRIDVSIDAGRGLKLTVDFDGKSCQHDVHVLSWHIDSLESDACLANAFGDINTIHFHKATDIAQGMTELCDVIRYKLALVASGQAFDAARERASIAKHGTFTERKAYWAACRAEENAARAAKGLEPIVYE